MNLIRLRLITLQEMRDCCTLILTEMWLHCNILYLSVHLDWIYCSVEYLQWTHWGCYMMWSAHLRLWDHNSVLLIPAYEPLLKQEKAAPRTIKVWPEEAVSALQNCFDHADWNKFKELPGATQTWRSMHHQPLATSSSVWISDVINCTVTAQPNQRSCLNSEVCSLLRCCMLIRWQSGTQGKDQPHQQCKESQGLLHMEDRTTISHQQCVVHPKQGFPHICCSHCQHVVAKRSCIPYCYLCAESHILYICWPW